MLGGSSSDASAVAGAWPLVGRQRELEQIAAARADQGCDGVVVVAAAGVGKSRLTKEALATAERDGALVQWVQATSSAATVPLGAVADLVPEPARSDNLVALMRRCGEELRDRAAGRAVVLAVDDAQLLDPVSAALVLHLATSSAAFVLATVRAGEPCPDAIVSLWKDDTARRIELDELGEEDVRALVETALGDPVEEEALRWVAEVSGGNALYARELVRGAVDDRALVHDPGFWRLDHRPAAGSSLRDLVASRMAGLNADQRAAVELLALGEPLRIEEIAELTSEATLIETEELGLVTVSGDEVGLAHPLYGETVRLALPPLRARRLRHQLVATLEARVPLRSDDVLRVARLRLDAGAELPSELALDAARAANRAGDPDLGAELAARAGAESSLAAAMVLAQALAARNRYQEAESAMAAVEHLAAGNPDAREYLRQRLWLHHWGLRADTGPLLDRAAGWTVDDDWPQFTTGIRSTYQGLTDGFAATEREISPDLPDKTQRSLATLRTLGMFLAGRGDEAAHAAWAARPAIPLRDEADAGALGALTLVATETGQRWAEVEEYMGQVVRDAVRTHDHGAAGLAAFTLGRLHFLGGRQQDTRRWLAEAEVHLLYQDPFNTMLGVRALQVGIAAGTGDFDATNTALERLHAWRRGHEPLPGQHVAIRRAEGWALRLRDAATAGRQLLEDASAFYEMPGLAAQLAYEALRTGTPAAPELREFGARCASRLVSAYAAHASAKAAHDGPALMAAAEEMADIGALSYAVEAASDAAAAFVAAGRQDSARRAAARARELHVPGQGTELPRIDGLDGAAIELTPREVQLVGLAAQGLSNAEIADRLVISVRTVETHLYRGMQKLGVKDRRDL